MEYPRYDCPSTIDAFLYLYPSYLVGGLSEFNVLHPSLCEISVPILKKSLNSSVSLRATTPGKW